MMDKLEHAWKIRDSSYSNIQLADTKAGFITGLSTLGVALLRDTPPDLPPWKIALVVLTGFLLLAAIIMAVLSVRPRSTNDPDGTIFWGHIAAFKDFATYKKALEQSDDFDEVAQQAFELSRITKRKHALIAWATSLLAAGLVTLWISLIVNKLIK
ncbi:hypothetical protein Mesil_0255 [Allomeiothermus silvanus DSM 9946]|uniref:Pycsar effector protein domain-containing protein n=2 Tax=Allomeiothermus silvanus TaxID=52022 RepID=D7BHG1_ALLS1|nr:Pycsar system effector family protein [Allomeiothermus silvanus]ADH62199.1 hypothetical protein Mesil_0255 [Allomeiothermus silvanus DSM 9946]